MTVLVFLGRKLIKNGIWSSFLIKTIVNKTTSGLFDERIIFIHIHKIHWSIIKKGVYNMSIVIGADAAGLRLKEVVKDFLEKENFHVVDVTAEGQDFVDVTLAVAEEVKKEEQNLGIVIDAYGAGPFMVATKIKGMVAAEVSDERSAYMTRGHNNSRMITMGAQLVGDELAKNIAKGFVNGKYDGGRHQIRVDMLNKMC